MSEADRKYLVDTLRTLEALKKFIKGLLDRHVAST